MAGHCHRPRTVVMRQVTDPPVSHRHHTPHEQTQTTGRGWPLPVLNNLGRSGLETETSRPHTTTTPAPPVAHQTYRAASTTTRSCMEPTRASCSTAAVPPPEPEAPGGGDSMRACRRRNVASSSTHCKRWGCGDLVYSHTWIAKTDTRRVHVKTQMPRQPSATMGAPPLMTNWLYSTHTVRVRPTGLPKSRKPHYNTYGSYAPCAPKH